MATGIQGGIKRIRKLQRIPEQPYMWKVAEVNEVKGGPNSKNPGATNLQARCVIDGGYDPASNEEVNLEDSNLVGRRADNFYLGCVETVSWYGLMRILNAAQKEDVPDGEQDENGNNLVKNIVGLRFPGYSRFNPDGYNGRPENDVIPIIDEEWLRAQNDEAFGEDEEEEDYEEEEDEEPEPPPRRKKKTTKKKAAKRTRSR